MTKLQIYSSSAGSGKTYTLTRTYLKLLLNSPQADYFRHILAITFTNDAANEMKERILDTLESLAQTNVENAYVTELASELGQTPEVILQRAQKTHELLLQDYSDFHVKTIDSFMNQVVQQFTEDLDLPFHYETALEAGPLLEEAVDRVIEQLNLEVSNPLSRALLDVAEEVVEQNKSWTKIRDLLVKSSQDALNDQHYFQIQQLAELDVADFQLLAHQIKKALQKKSNELENIGREAVQIIQNQGLINQDFYQGDKGLGAFFSKLYHNPSAHLGPVKISSYLLKTVEENKWASGKASSSTLAAIDRVKDDLSELFNQYRDYQTQEAPRYFLLQTIQKELHRLALIHQIKQAFDEVLQDNQQVFIADFNRRILDIVLNEPVPFIYERLGEKFNHLLIDEFQDTSELQFFNLLPLLENGLAQGYFSLVVGDAKQAIYRWRGGKMSLLVHLAGKDLTSLLQNPVLTDNQREQFYGIYPYLDRANLTTNYRSTQEIIRFNNQLFEHILQTKKSDYPFLAEVYQDYFQQTPTSSLEGGQVEIQMSTQEDWLEKTHQKILEFHEEGYAWGDMACLFRKNDLSGQLAEFLIARNIPISTSDSLLLSRAWEIQVLVGLMRAKAYTRQPAYLIGPLSLYAQKIKPQLVDNLWLPRLTSVQNWIDTLPFWHELGVQLPDSAHSLYSQVENWSHALGFFGTHGRTEYTVSFLEFVLQTTSKVGNHLTDVLDEWDKKSNSLSVQTQAKSDAVTIQTIHKSKGLAYPVVLLPHLHWSTTPKAGSKVWMDLSSLDEPLFEVESAERGTRRLKTAPLSASNDMLATDLQEQVIEERTQTYLEALNMLYVALTRPEEKLWISLNQDQLKENTIGSLIQDFLKQLEPEENGGWIISKGIAGRLKSEDTTKSEEMQSWIPLAWKKLPGSPMEKLKLRRSAERFFAIQSADQSKDRGTKIHAILAEISSKEEVETVMQRAVLAGWISAEEAPELRQDLQKWLDMSDLSPYFAPGLVVDRERDILLPGGKTIRPDRVVYFHDRTVIIDFKTGQIRPNYIKQLQTYATAFEQMKFPSVEAWLIYLDEKLAQKAYPD